MAKTTKNPKPLTKKQIEKRDALFEKITQEDLFLETLEVRGWDTYDFPEVSVAGLKTAFIKIYEAGRASIKTTGN